MNNKELKDKEIEKVSGGSNLDNPEINNGIFPVSENMRSIKVRCADGIYRNATVIGTTADPMLVANPDFVVRFEDGSQGIYSLSDILFNCTED